jgi:cell wall-associated NlpC family hydrolase
MPRFLSMFVVTALAGFGLQAHSQEPAYRSPYRVVFTQQTAELVGDLERTERGDLRLESEIPFQEWYSPRTRERWHAWGPPAAFYPRPPGVERWTTERKRERVIAVAMRFQGYAYQHHHIPDWSPPQTWPWLKSCAGANSKGVDCSNLTGFVYNQGFGLRLNTDVHLQSEERSGRATNGRPTRLHPVELPSSFDDRLSTLRTGDLLFIRSGPGGKISHVVIWVGPIGQSPDGLPLVLDSHGEDTRDSNGQLIPCGVHLRPFRENSWYNRSASHALRVFLD